MSTPLILGYGNNIMGSGVTITPNQEDPDFPASNLLLDQRQLIWRTLDVAAQREIAIDLGAAQRFSNTMAVAFDVNCRSTGGGIPSLVAYTDATYTVVLVNLGGATAYNFTDPAATTHALNRFAYWTIPAGAATTARYWKFISNGAVAIDAFLSVGKFFMGQGLTLAKNYRYGITYTYVDPTVKRRVPGGSMNVNRLPPYWQVRCDIPRLSRSDSNALRTVVDTVGRAQPLVAIWDYDNDVARKTLYGRLDSNIGFQHVRGDLFDHGPILFEEDI